MRMSLLKGSLETKKPPPKQGFERLLFADLGGIPQGDSKEQGANTEGKDEDVSEAFHRC
jgi:hypothetical protein